MPFSLIVNPPGIANSGPRWKWWFHGETSHVLIFTLFVIITLYDFTLNSSWAPNSKSMNQVWIHRGSQGTKFFMKSHRLKSSPFIVNSQSTSVAQVACEVRWFHKKSQSMKAWIHAVNITNCDFSRDARVWNLTCWIHRVSPWIHAGPEFAMCSQLRS